MLICHCKRVSDRAIRAAAHDGARTVAQVGRACDAGTGCGGCVTAIAEIIDEESRPARVLPLTSFPAAQEVLPLAAE